MRRWLLAIAALAFSAASAQASPLRIAEIGPGKSGCKAPDAAAPAGERAYYAHLARRLGVEVLKCLVPDATAAASALAGGEVDVATLDPPAFVGVRTATRAILSIRSAGASNRIPVILAVRAGDPRRTLLALKGARLALGGRTAAGLDTPRAMLAVRGAGPGFFREEIEPDGEVAFDRLRSGHVDALAVHAAAWQRSCRMESPRTPNPCRDLFVILKARPQAERALVVRRDMPLELRYRLIGIHMALHLEAPAAFAYAAAWAKAPAEFQPAEADALSLASVK